MVSRIQTRSGPASSSFNDLAIELRTSLAVFLLLQTHLDPLLFREMLNSCSSGRPYSLWCACIDEMGLHCLRGPTCALYFNPAIFETKLLNDDPEHRCWRTGRMPSTTNLITDARVVRIPTPAAARRNTHICPIQSEIANPTHVDHGPECLESLGTRVLLRRRLLGDESILICMGFESEARGSRRNKQPSPVLVRQTKR